jgi:hypothetical protein
VLFHRAGEATRHGTRTRLICHCREVELSLVIGCRVTTPWPCHSGREIEHLPALPASRGWGTCASHSFACLGAITISACWERGSVCDTSGTYPQGALVSGNTNTSMPVLVAPSLGDSPCQHLHSCLPRFGCLNGFCPDMLPRSCDIPPPDIRDLTPLKCAASDA